MNKDIQAARRAALKKLVTDYEGMNALARQLGLAKGAYISQLLVDPPHRSLSEKTARKWEQTLNLPAGWMDRGGVTPGMAAAAAAVDALVLTKVIAAVNEAVADQKVSITPAKLADVIVMQYTDALALGTVNVERIRTLIGFLK